MIKLKADNGNKILHDAYFEKKPSILFLTAVRLILLCVMSGSLCLMFCDLYGDGNGLIAAGCAVLCTALVYMLDCVLPSAAVYGGITVIAAVIGYLLRNRIRVTAIYFWNYMMLRLDSRLLHTSELLAGNPMIIKRGSLDGEMEAAFFIASVVLGIICSVLFTAAGRTRFHLSVPAIAAFIVAAPAVAAETAGFFPSFLGYIASVFALESVSASYELDSGLVFGNLFSAHNAVRQNEAKYKKRTRFYSFLKKLKNDAPRYQKYTANSITMFIVTAIVFSCVASAVPEGQGVSYEEVFDAMGRAATSVADTFGNILGTTFGTADDKGYFTFSSYGDISGSISLEPPSSSDMPVLQVSVGRNDIPIYLRGDIGVEFNGNGWNSVQESYKSYLNDMYSVSMKDDAGIITNQAITLSSLLDSFYPETAYRAFRQYLAASGNNPDSIIPLQKVSVTYLRNTRVVFQPLAPYELDYKDSDYYDCFGDFVLRTKEGYIKNHESLALTPSLCLMSFYYNGKSASQVFSEAAESAAWFGYSDEKLSQTDFENYNKAYCDISKYIYGRNSDDDRELIGDFVNEIRYSGALNGCNTDFERAKAVSDYFKDHFTYSLEAENGARPMKSFLYETRSGHCALFATAATLVMRELGLTARYVTGYVAAGTGTPSPVGYDYTLTEKQLHAWVEVLFPETGWLAFDPTAAVPGFAEIVGIPPQTSASSYDEPEPPESSETTLSPEESEISETDDEPELNAENEETDTQDDTTSPDDPDNANAAENEETQEGSGGAAAPREPEMSIADIFAKLLPYITALVLAAAAVTVFVMLVRSVDRAEAQTVKGFKKNDPSKACADMYRFVLRLLKKRGIEPENELLMDFAQRVDKTLQSQGVIFRALGMNVFMADIVPILEKCEFGDPMISPVTADERKSVYAFVSSVYGGIMRRKGPIGRFFMKISLFL